MQDWEIDLKACILIILTHIIGQSWDMNQGQYR